MTPMASSTLHFSSPSPMALTIRLARRFSHKLLSNLRNGELILEEGDSRYSFGKQSMLDPLSVGVRIHDAGTYSKLLLGGSIGAAEAYMNGEWDCDDLPSLVRLFARNRTALERLDNRWSRLFAPTYRHFDRLRRNTRRGSRRNIAEHYDLGNEFFESFLDSTMMYSCAVFDEEDWSLERAQIEKMDRLCRKLELSETDHLLEIGSGWGGFAIHAARTYGCRVTTTTISDEQFAEAGRRIVQAGLADRITLLKQDYRDLTGTYDKLVSIEMLEAVGYEYHGVFFRKCSELLRPGGRAVIQTITIADQQFERARHETDFIRRYIFPGGCLPSVTSLSTTLTQSTSFRLSGLEDLTLHYATTLKHWMHRFRRRIEHIRSLGYPESFIRRWEYYFCYCEGGFREKAIGLVQLEIEKPRFD